MSGEAPRHAGCAHTTGLPDPEPPSSGESCRRCEETRQHPVQLRKCLLCGHVGCCDSSPSRHATAHFEETGHAVMRSYEAGEQWRWCYEERRLV
ncbi:UBP-type zinc finger domain-containing protein [Streptacidiphilus griseoplanus]|uniref:UBP-type zinc finger domain-containing protein n=1 Tax=Peterkaempfera griseoplana TaxID=66896 RepID=UPI0006E13A34|nr:UBP-type zinc finger domain-containing protein [Peterkaempfera griseoplana]